jgi:cytoskeletal protein RodZ
VTEPAVHQLGEVLRAAREAKGVDLRRVERETKIRERYLAALESGDYRDLPGSVYTKGFLRNYGSYLGLDPEYLIDLYRLETSAASAERPRAPVPPRPLAAKRSRAFVVTPGAIVGAILFVMVGAFIAYLAFEFINFARTPELRITQPAGNVSGYTSLTMTVRGVTAPNARITVSNLRENPVVEADDEGNFEVTVGLVPGSNVMRLVARDPVTGRDSEIEERMILVATDSDESPTPAPVALDVSEPVADATLSGPVPIRGTASPGSTLTVVATLVSSLEPTFAITDAAGSAVEPSITDPAAPAPLELTADGTGAFEGSVVLPPGVWDLAIEVADGESAARRVTIAQGDGLAVALAIEGGDSWIEADADGVPVTNVTRRIAADGESIDVSAVDELRILAGNAGAVRVTVNDIEIGVMGGDGTVVEWQISRTDG